MRIFSKLVIIILMLGLIADSISCRKPQTYQPIDPTLLDSCKNSNFDDWKEISANKKFVFMVPNDLQKQEVKGIDSYFAEYKNNNLKLSFEYGEHSNPLDSKEFSTYPNYKEVILTIDDKAAKLITYEYSLQNLLDRSKYDKQLQDFKYGTAIHFNKLFNIDESKYLRIPTLTMWVSCKDIKDLEIAIKIFYSIHFPK